MPKFLKDLKVDVAQDPDVKARKLTQDDVETVLRKALGVMGDYLADGHKLYLIGFMNFEPKDYRAKMSKHPQTGEDMVIDPYRAVLSKPSSALKEKLEEGRKRSPIRD